MSIPTKKSRESEAFDSNLEEMRQKTFHSFSAMPIIFGNGNVHDCLQLGDERKGVEIVRMNRLERMSRELLEERSTPARAVNYEENDMQQNDDHNYMVVKMQQMIKLLEEIKKDNQKMEQDMHYMALRDMQKDTDATTIGEQEMKQLAVILNRVSGIILTILNVGLIIKSATTIFS